MSKKSRKLLIKSMEISFSGNKLHYRVQGPAQAPTLVFIHGGGLDQRQWEAQITHFSNQYQVITYDLRGHGQSTSNNNDGLDMDDLLAILHKQEVNQFALVGCSLGSIIAIDLALAYPEKVKKLVLVSPGLVGFQEHNHAYLDILSQYISYIEQKNTQQAKMTLKKLTFYGPGRWLSDHFVADTYVDQCLTHFIESGNYARVPQLRNFEPLTKLPYLSCPVLLIRGKLDYDYINENVQKLQELVSQAQSVVIDKTGHVPNLEQSKEFNQVVEEFLNSPR